MSYSKVIKKRAEILRRKGASVLEIARELDIAKSTASLWVRNVPLQKDIAMQLLNKELFGGAKGLAILTAKRNLARIQYKKEAEKLLHKIRPLEKTSLLQLFCALIFWCEGSKRNISRVIFTNSDPALVKLFIYTLSYGFDIDISKLRALIHLHEYHDARLQTVFWSKITGIPTSRFTKPYIKANTGRRKRNNYQGCISIRYGDAKIAKKLDALYHALAEQALKGA